MRHCLVLLGILLLSACAAQVPAAPALPTASIVPTLQPTSAARVLTPTIAPAPTALPAATPTPSPMPVPADDQAAVQTALVEGLPRDPIRLAQDWGILTQTLSLPARDPASVGEREVFWATNVATTEHFQITATLRVKSPHLLLYIADGVVVEDSVLQTAANTFEQQSWPLLSQWYPEAVLPRTPITVLNADIPGVGGYYATDNELPRALNRYSNEREIIYVNAADADFSGRGYLSVLTHETQHLLHRNVLIDPATWFNEGLSMLSEDRTGVGSDTLVQAFLVDPDLQLNDWADTPDAALSHYGAAQLFLRYLHAQSTNGLPVGALALADAGDRLDSLLQAVPRLSDLQTFGDLYATWATANTLNDATVADGRYAYAGLPAPVEPAPASSRAEGTVHQLGADYLAWEPAPTERQIVWDGNPTVPVIAAPVAAGEQVWWSGRGDARVSTLTTAITVPATGATLNYRVWIDLEENYDYAYLTISVDGGKTWRSLPTASSSGTNPLGLNLGGGWTGAQRAWRTEQVDLGPWQGQRIQLRFWTITDEGYNASGIALADVGVEGVPATWSGAGFVMIRNRLPQAWELRAIVYPPNAPPQVVEIPVVAGHAEWTLPANQRVTLVVVGASPGTTQLAAYRYVVQP